MGLLRDPAIPFAGAIWVAYWDKFRRPEVAPKYAPGLETWWVDPQAEQTVETKKEERDGAK